jgi:hypothetical protein
MSWWVGVLIWVGFALLLWFVVATTQAGWKLWVFLMVMVGLLLTTTTITVNHQEKSCEQRGGHTGPKSLCLTPDGRVIE